MHYSSELLAELAGIFRAHKRSTRSAKSTIRPHAEALEQRLALSTYVPSGCACPFCCGAAQPYVVAGSSAPGAAYQAAGYRWPQSSPGAPVTVTYSYSNLLNGGLGGGLPAPAIKATIQEALGRWAAVAPLTFVERPDAGPAPSDQNYDGTGLPQLRFGHRYVDGAYNVLAYGYYPGSAGLSGDVQFDSSENWATNPRVGRDLLEVATHEIGHALGLAHQPGPAGGVTAIMNPIYAGRYNGLGTSFLYPDDVSGIQALYGAGSGSVVPLGSVTPLPPTTPPTPGLEATLTGPTTAPLDAPVVVTFEDVRTGQHFAYDFDNDGAWDVGNGTYAGSPTTTSVTLPQRFFASPRTLIVRGRVINADGTFRDTYVGIQIASRMAVVSLPSSASIGQTDHLRVTGSFSDPDSQAWSVSVDYGDGTGPTPVQLSGNSFTLDHGFARPGTYSVVVYVTDNHGSVGVGRLTVTVAAESPQVLFIDNLFRQVLHRDVSPGEEANLVAALQRGVPASVIVNDVWNSDEARAGRLAEYYRTIMGREIDPSGQQSWLDNMRRGMIDEDVILALVASQEFIDATPRNADFVRIVFRHVLKRDTDDTGLASWTAHLDRGMTRADLVLNVLRSAERQTNLLDHYFEEYLGRDFTSADVAAWRPGSNPNLTTANLTTAILASAEFQGRAWWV